MEYTKQNDELNFIDFQFSNEPRINIISKEKFEERVSEVFNILWEKLSKSFGPGGAGTFISRFPEYYTTKDGFTIMKNIAFDKKLDQVISNMVRAICDRLNFTVGDGTTTAVIATKSTYDSYVSKKDFFAQESVLPRQILAQFEEFKKEILKELDIRAKSIQSDNPEVLKENISKVVSISSNGNEEITDMISSLYEELKYPAISHSIAKDGIMKSYITEGYKIDTCLTDKLYINNDNNTMILDGADVLVFDHKVTQETYEMILKPLASMSKDRERHLICIAPFYDEKALSGVIKTDLTRQYKTNNSISLVLMVCSKVTGLEKIRLEDLAMLLNTMVISSSMEKELISKIKTRSNTDSYPHNKIFNMDFREISGTCVLVESDPTGSSVTLKREYVGNINTTDIWDYTDEVISEGFRIGYCGSCVLGLSESTFADFHYDQNQYNIYLKTAKDELEEVRRKCENIGAFSLQLTEKQQRFYSLGLKTGVIEVGSTSELSQGYLKDTVDDSIKAAASAFNNGVVLGCNVTLISIIDGMMKKYETNDAEHSKLHILKSLLLKILKDGYIQVYRTVLENVISDDSLIEYADLDTAHYLFIDKLYKIYEMSGISKYVIENNISAEFFRENLPMDYFTSKKTVVDIIIDLSINSGTVFDVSAAQFNHDVINSTETDKEILKATIDLLSLLITGNQLVLC